MDFETLWSRYRSGTAGGEEISQVEAELEKFRLLEAYIEEERPPLPPPDAQRLQEELRRARRQVRRRTARVAAGVLAAVLALGLLAQLVLFPAINRRAVKVDWPGIRPTCPRRCRCSPHCASPRELFRCVRRKQRIRDGKTDVSVLG